MTKYVIMCDTEEHFGMTYEGVSEWAWYTLMNVMASDTSTIPQEVDE